MIRQALACVWLWGALTSTHVTATALETPTAVLTVRALDPKLVPVARASVTVTPFGTYRTGANGEVQIDGLPAAIVSVAVSAEGYFANEAKRVDLSAGGPTVVVVELQPRTVSNETVVVTATGTESLAEEAPIRTELITHDVVDRQIKTTLAEAFQATISGVRVEMNCQNCGFIQLRINGLDGPYAQILEDGLPSYSGVTAVYGLEQIPAAFVDQIEVVKGGNSALYGPGAVAGVVNLIRREPRENRFRLDLMSGWQGGRPEQQVGANAQLIDLPGDFAGDFYFRSTNRVPVDRDRDGFTDLGKRKLDSGGFGLFRRFLGGNARLSIDGTIAQEFRRGGDQFDRPPEETWITEQIDSRRYTMALKWNHTISSTTFYSARSSLAYYGRRTYYGSGMDPNAYGNTRDPLWLGDAQVGHQAGRHSLLGGYQVQWEHVEDNAPAYGRTYGGTFQNHGVYLQDEWRATAGFSLIGGARFDKANQVDRWIVSPRVGAKYGLTPNLVWRGSVSTGFRAPGVFDEDLHIAQVGGEGFLLQNSSDLSEEKSISLATGFDYNGSVRDRQYQIAVNGFYTDLRDAFTLVEDHVAAGFRRLLRVNGPGASVRGIDLDGKFRLAPQLGLRGGFTVQTARWKQPEEQFGAKDFFRTPRHYGFAGFDLDLPGKIELLTTTDFTGSMLVPHYAGYIKTDRLERSRRFAVVNIVASRTFTIGDRGTMRAFFNLQNLGDQYQPDLDRGPNRDSAYVYGPAEMRRAVVGLTYQF